MPRGAVAINVSGDVDRVTETAQPNNRRSVREACRKLGCCIRISPWVSIISCVFVALGLAVWSVYVKRALASTQALSSALINEPVLLLQDLTVWVNWAWLVGIIAVSSISGICFFTGVFRSYQKAAQLPSTNCATPGKFSYGSYAALATAANIAVWLLSVGISLAIAGHLVWLVGAFLTQSAVTQGMTYTTGSEPVPAQQQQVASTALAVGLKTSQVTSVKASNISTCPTSCFNLGSLYAVLQLSSSCYCNSYDPAYLASTSTALWKNLVHCLAALALAGVGCTWLLMNLSANFAHARRDIRENPGWDKELLQLQQQGDAFAAVRTSKKDKSGKEVLLTPVVQDTMSGHEVDRSPAPGTPEFTPLDALPAAVIHANAANTNTISNADIAQDPYSYNYPSATAADVAGAASTAGVEIGGVAAGTAAAGSTGRASNSGEAGEGASPSSASRTATFNSTAQRYAAYRLRAAQSKQGSTPDRKWQR